jgi:hypothetical protein
LSVDSLTKRVTVGSYGSFSRGKKGRGEEGEGEETEEEGGSETALSRVPPPPGEVEYVRVQRGPATRWVDLRGASGGSVAKYVAPAIIATT